MKLRHVALVYSSEEKADRFLTGALLLTKSEPKTLPPDMCRPIAVPVSDQAWSSRQRCGRYASASHRQRLAPCGLPHLG